MSHKNPKNLQRDKNPIQVRREQLGMTQHVLHAVADCSFHTVQRVEQGLMPKVPYTIFDRLYGANFSYDGVNERYDDWKVSTRKANRKYLDYCIENPELWFSWLDFRLLISESKAGFCKLYCIHPHVLDHFEAPDKVDKRTRLAPLIAKSFFDAGLSVADIELIEQKLNWGVAGKELANGG